MRRLFSLMITLFLIQNVGLCQINNSNINTRYTMRSLFLFNTFQEGVAYFDDGGIAKAKYNYNAVYDEICYINKSKILVVSNVDELDSVKIGSKIFRYIDGKTLETIYSGKISVYLGRKANVPSDQPSGAYGTESNTSAVTKKTSIYSNYGSVAGEYANFQDDTDLEISVSESLYLLINNELILASKYFINKKFKAQKSEIKDFINDNNIDLKNNNDLIKLASFLEGFI